MCHSEEVKFLDSKTTESAFGPNSKSVHKIFICGCGCKFGQTFNAPEISSEISIESIVSSKTLLWFEHDKSVSLKLTLEQTEALLKEIRRTKTKVLYPVIAILVYSYILGEDHGEPLYRIVDEGGFIYNNRTLSEARNKQRQCGGSIYPMSSKFEKEFEEAVKQFKNK